MVADGDSITIGQGATTAYTGLLSLTEKYKITNVGISAELLSTMLANAPTAVDVLYNPNVTRNIVVIWGGTNDLAFGGKTPAQVYSTMQSYCSARHSVGWKCIVATMLSRSGLDTQKNTLNNLILANHGFADGLADFTSTNLGCDGCSSNSTYFQADGIHPNQNGITTIEAPIIGAAINALP